MEVRESTGSPLSIPAFRRAWAGATVSAAGDAASWIALVALALGPARASLPVLVALYTAPVALGGLAAGWVLDRFDRRSVMIADSLARAAAFATIPVVAAFTTVPPLPLYGVAAVYGLLKMVSLAGFPTLIPALVPARLLEQANALEGAGFGLAGLAGAALAGLAVAGAGPVPVVAFDVASYVGFAVALWSVGRLPGSPGSPRTVEGKVPVARLLIREPVLRSTTIMFALFNVGEGCLLVFLPSRAFELGLGSGGYGYLVAATTGGELVAAALLLRRPWPWPLRMSIVVAQLVAATMVTLLVLPSAAITFVVLAAVGLCAAPMTAWAQTLRMRTVPPGAHGRLFALLRTAMQATPPLGAGLAALTHGPTATVLAAAAVMGVPAVLLAPDLVRSAS